LQDNKASLGQVGRHLQEWSQSKLNHLTKAFDNIKMEQGEDVNDYTVDAISNKSTQIPKFDR